MSAINVTGFKFATRDAFAAALQGNEARRDAVRETYLSMDVDRAVTVLAQVGRLLQVAQSTSQGFCCSAEVISMGKHYEKAIKGCLTAFKKATPVFLTVLQGHYTACVLLDRGQLFQAVKLIGDGAQMAEEMATLSGFLAKKVRDLLSQSARILESVAQDEALPIEQRDAIQARQQAEGREAAALDLQQSLLNECMRKAREDERRAAENAALAQRGQFISNRIAEMMVLVRHVDSQSQSVIETLSSMERIESECSLPPCSEGSPRRKRSRNESNPEAAQSVLGADTESALVLGVRGAEEVEDPEVHVRRIRGQLQKGHQTECAQWASRVTQLQSASRAADTSGMAVASVETLVKTLRYVTAVFANAQMFWLGAQKGYSDWVSLVLRREEGQPAAVPIVELKAALVQSAERWCVLGHIHDIARRQLEDPEVEALSREMLAHIEGEV
jgi:hypothetical protein